jgi:hypothetical protein
MNQHMIRIGLGTFIASSALLLGSVGDAVANRELQSVPQPDPTVPLASWTPAQQLRIEGADRYGYNSAGGMLMLADDLADRLGHLGRISALSRCFREPDPRGGGIEFHPQVLGWALCRDDFAAIDLTKAEAELVAAGVSKEDQERGMEWIKKEYDLAKKVIAHFDDAAKTDRGLKKVRAEVEAAKKEWADYLAAHRADHELYLTLKDAARSGKRNNPAFEGCDGKTRARFEKHVRSVAKKIPADTETLEGFIYHLAGDSIDGYITTASWATCAFSVHPAADQVIAYTFTSGPEVVRVGWRTVAIGKLTAKDYKPRFDDSKYYLSKSDFSQYHELPGFSKLDHPTWGDVTKVEKHDDELKVYFGRGEIVGACYRWETRHGEKYCAERGNYEEDVAPVNVPLAYAAGIKKGVWMQTGGRQFPLVVRKGKKPVAILGVVLK